MVGILVIDMSFQYLQYWRIWRLRARLSFILPTFPSIHYRIFGVHSIARGHPHAAFALSTALYASPDPHGMHAPRAAAPRRAAMPSLTSCALGNARPDPCMPRLACCWQYCIFSEVTSAMPSRSSRSLSCFSAKFAVSATCDLPAD